MTSPPPRHRPARRGSVLLVGLMFAGILAVSLASYVQLAKGSLELSQRTLWANAAMNLAENGLEEAMYSLNRRNDDPSYSWSAAGWQTDDDDVGRRWTNLPVDGAARGEIRVFVYNYRGESPNIVARGTVFPPVGSSAPPVEKWVLIRARRTSRFASGLVARQSILFNGASATVDSWISKPPLSATLPYDPSRARDQASIGSTSVAVNAVSVNNARIFGYAATGGALPQVGPQGSIGDFKNALGSMDMSRVSTYFFANFEAGFNAKLLTSSYGFKTTTQSPAQLGVMGQGGKWIMPSLTLNGTEVWNITGKVELYLNTQSTTANNISNAISISGSAGISLAAGATLTIYTVGDVRIGGNGVINVNSTGTTAGNPANFQLYGQSTATGSPQTIDIGGNAAFSGVIYAPNAAVTLSGGDNNDRDILGSIVANTITFNGRVAFHQDESLATLTPLAPFRPSAWNELTTPTEREPYRDDLDEI